MIRFLFIFFIKNRTKLMTDLQFDPSNQSGLIFKTRLLSPMSYLKLKSFAAMAYNSGGYRQSTAIDYWQTPFWTHIYRENTYVRFIFHIYVKLTLNFLKNCSNWPWTEVIPPTHSKSNSKFYGFCTQMFISMLRPKLQQIDTKSIP